MRLPDGREAVAKTVTYDARLEVDGLESLRAAGIRTPDILEVSDHRLVMELVTGPADWEGLGRDLATVHRSTSDRFGWHLDNVIGPLPQVNTRCASWGEFFAKCRVRVHLDDPAVPGDLAYRLRVACDGPLVALLEEHRPVPSLVHGDLWSGNIVSGAAVIDPAVAYADREMELAFLTLFGGVPDAFLRSYVEAWPLADGWERRRPVLRLHHLLVHVRLFGGGYVSQLEAVVDGAGW